MMPLWMAGAVKIMWEDKEGDKLLLYFLERGDTCAITLSYCLGQTKNEIRDVAEHVTGIIIVPIEKNEIMDF